MANTKISALPLYSSPTNEDLYFVNNNSGETITTKIKLNQFQGLTQGEGTYTIQSNTYFGDLGTTAMTENSIAIGNGAEATSPRGIAIGYKAYNVNRDFGRNDYIAIGTEAQCVQESVSIGLNCSVQGANAIGIGTQTRVYNNYATALNYQAEAHGEGSTAIGYQAPSRGIGSVAMGWGLQPNGLYSVSIGGVSNTLTSDFSTILGGSGNTITSLDHTAMIGCIDRTATTSGATFVENLVVFNYAALNFADDTAAAAGGVVLGQVYHDLGALRIRIV